MKKYPTYDVGDYVCAWSNYLSEAGVWLTVRGWVLKDDGGEMLTIKPERGTNFDNKESFEVHKDRIF